MSSQSPSEETASSSQGTKNLTDWFSRVYILNCAHRPDRKDQILAHLNESKMADVDKVVVYPAIIGDWTTHPADWGAGRGAWGCLRSHQRMMEDFMHARDERGMPQLESILILEDDCYFVDGALEMLNCFMTKVPSDWGQIYLGGQHRRNAEKTINPEVLVGGSINRTHAYAVSFTHVQAVYRHISYAPDYRGTAKHIDHQLELAHQRKDWPVYCPQKWIAGQEAGASNISGKTNGRQIWQ